MIVHKNPYFLVNQNNDYYSISFLNEQVTILPIVDNDYILLIKAIRPVFQSPVIELPAGTVDKGETLENAALRELAEETGVNIKDSKRIKPIRMLNIIPSRTSQMLNVYQANITIEEYQKRNNHDDEVDGTLLLNHDDLIRKIESGEIFVATTIAVCLQYILVNKKIDGEV